MTRQRIPDEVLTATHDRAAARAAHDWLESDRLRAEIETAGWRIVDRGTDFALRPAVPPDVANGDSIRYGSSGSVPSVLEEAPVGLATVVLLADGDAPDIGRAIGALRANAPAGTSIVVVTSQDAGDDDVRLSEADQGGRAPLEIVRTTEWLGYGAALNAGARRAVSPVIIALEMRVEPQGDIVTPLANALGDPGVAIVGPWALGSLDLRRFEEVASGDAVAIDSACLAFRRDDHVRRGPIDERFHSAEMTAIWWSLVLRDAGEGSPARMALGLAGIPAVHRPRMVAPDDEDRGRDRDRRRDVYRVLDGFRTRPDLLSADRP